jgi:hypothetical protein
VFVWKSFAVVREAFSNACPDKEVPSKTTLMMIVMPMGRDYFSELRPPMGLFFIRR